MFTISYDGSRGGALSRMRRARSDLAIETLDCATGTYPASCPDALRCHPMNSMYREPRISLLLVTY